MIPLSRISSLLSFRRGRDNNFSALAEDSVLSTHPIEIPVHRPEEVSQIFDSISYSKGATVIRMLYEHIGMDMKGRVIL